MTALIQIGNSRGIRIPKAIIKQANLDNSEISFEITENGLLLKPIKNKSRKNWKELIETELKKDIQLDKEQENIENEFLNLDLEDEEWVW